MFENFASLHAYIATLAFASASSSPSEAPLAHLPADDAVPVPTPDVAHGKPTRQGTRSPSIQTSAMGIIQAAHSREWT
jgi:hypothetical protein